MATSFSTRLIYTGAVFLLAAVVIYGSLSFNHDSRFQYRSIVAYAKYLFYSGSLLAINFTQPASTIGALSGTNDNENEHALSVPVLVYHGILSKSDGTTINVTENQFKEQLFALRDAGYTSITLEELYAFGRGAGSLPAHPVLITFDDGRADAFYNGGPILNAVGYTAVMFPVAKYTRDAQPGGYYLSSQEVAQMSKTNTWEIGSHSYAGHEKQPIDAEGATGNFFSHQLWLPDQGRLETEEEFKNRILSDLNDSKQYFETLSEKPVVSFAFPFGDFGQNNEEYSESDQIRTDEIKTIASSVYNLLFYQQQTGEYYSQFIAPQGNTQTLFVRRIDINGEWSTEEFMDALKKGNQKSLPYNDSFDTDNGWLSTWGEHRFENGSLLMGGDPLRTGASTLIDGTATWKDYHVSADVVSPNRTGVFLWTRFQNDRNNAGCNFGVNFVHAEQILNGQKRVLKGVNLDGVIPEGTFRVSATVEGRTLICSINDVEILRTEFLDPQLSHGGIGVKIWDSTPGKASVIIEQLSVEPINS